MKIIDIRIECDDDLFDLAWGEAEAVSYDIDIREPDGTRSRRYAVDVFDVSEEGTP